MQNKELDKTLANSSGTQVAAKVEDPNLGTFAARIAFLVQHFGSVAEVARKSGSSDTAVRKWMDGAEPSRDRCLALAKGTGTSLLWLLGGVQPIWEADMSAAERDTQTIVLGEPGDEAVKAAWMRRDAAIKGFAAGFAASDGGSQPLRHDDLKMALQLTQEALGHKVLPPDKHAELVTLVYELLEEGMPEAKVLRFARAAAA